jgi:hypothetical protein
MRWHELAMLACAWVLWAQTRTSGPGSPVTDDWDIVDTFKTRAECELARVAVDPSPVPELSRPFRTRYVCFPDTQDPRATP